MMCLFPQAFQAAGLAPEGVGRWPGHSLETTRLLVLPWLLVDGRCGAASGLLWGIGAVRASFSRKGCVGDPCRLDVCLALAGDWPFGALGESRGLRASSSVG